MKLTVLAETFAVCRLRSSEAIPIWANQGTFFSITKTADELSIVCDESSVPAGVIVEKNWRAVQVFGPLDFSLTGILASIADPLASVQISIFAISTFDTDYILVKASKLEEAKESLLARGFTFV